MLIPFLRVSDLTFFTWMPENMFFSDLELDNFPGICPSIIILYQGIPKNSMLFQLFQHRRDVISQQVIVVITPQQQEDFPPEFGLVLRLMMAHTHHEGMERFMTDRMRLSVTSRSGCQAGSKMA